MPTEEFVKPKLYGRFLDDPDRLDQYEKRTGKTYSLAVGVVEHYEKKHPNLQGCLSVSYSNILLAVGRYMNDLYYSVSAHEINNFHRSKIAAYTIRWFLIYNPITPNVTREKYNSLSKEEKKVIFDIGFHFIDVFIAFVFHDSQYLAVDKKSYNLNRRFRYYLKTDSYSAKMATLFFESHYN